MPRECNLNCLHRDEKELVNFIRSERRRELCFEGHRWPDLRRYAVNTKYPLETTIRHMVYETENGEYAGYYLLKLTGRIMAGLCLSGVRKYHIVRVYWKIRIARNVRMKTRILEENRE